MIFFATVLRALAAAIITNSHYTGVYPTDIIANGGLFGDVIFFAVSGFCLVNVKDNFPKWYLKRILRIFPTVIVISAVFCISGLFKLNPESGMLGELFRMFIYPTSYHFIASIILLYIPYYFVMKIDKLRNNIPVVAAAVALVWLVIYALFYDKSYYHIDTVREPMIRFLFFFSMLMGAYFRNNKDKFINRKSVVSWILLPVLFVVYFISKLFFSKSDLLLDFQILNQIILFALLFVTFRCFASIDGILEKLPAPIKKVLNFISGITLEIYLVQIPLIQVLNIFPFPFNWIFITSVIVLLAFVLNKISGLIQKGINKICKI